MTEAEAKTLMGVIHGHWPKIALKRAGEWNKDVSDSWSKYLQELDHETTCAVIGDLFTGKLAMFDGNKTPDFRGVRSEVCRRVGMHSQTETFNEAQGKPIRLSNFEDGDYVTLNPPHFPPWEHILPGGRVEKMEDGDCIADIPHAVNWKDCKGYHLMSCPVTNPAELRHIQLMNDSQREAWIKDMDKLQRAGQFSKFRLPRPHKRGGEPEVIEELF